MYVTCASGCDAGRRRKSFLDQSIRANPAGANPVRANRNLRTGQFFHPRNHDSWSLFGTRRTVLALGSRWKTIVLGRDLAGVNPDIVGVDLNGSQVLIEVASLGFIKNPYSQECVLCVEQILQSGNTVPCGRRARRRSRARKHRRADGCSHPESCWCCRRRT